jgi:hypothetical protein
VVLLKQCDPTAATSTSRAAASSAIKRATSLFEQLYPNITRDPLRQDEAGQERSNYNCFCPNRSLSATTPRLSLARLVLSFCLPGPWRLPEAGGEAVSIHTALHSPLPPRHPTLFPSAQRCELPLLPWPFLLNPPRLSFPSLHYAFCTTSSSPLRFSGHILCSLSQVEPRHCLHVTYLYADVVDSFGVTTSPAHCKSLTFTTRCVAFTSSPAFLLFTSSPPFLPFTSPYHTMSPSSTQIPITRSRLA